MRYEVQYTSEGGGILTNESYCEKNPPYISHQKIMRIMYRYYPQENPNIFLFNQRKVRRPGDGIVSVSRGITIFGSMHASI